MIKRSLVDISILGSLPESIEAGSENWPVVCERRFSLIVHGVNDFCWIAYCFSGSDPRPDAEEENMDDLDEGDDDFDLSPKSFAAPTSTKCPREYFIRLLTIHVARIAMQWKQTGLYMECTMKKKVISVTVFKLESDIYCRIWIHFHG